MLDRRKFLRLAGAGAGAAGLAGSGYWLGHHGGAGDGSGDGAAPPATDPSSSAATDPAPSGSLAAPSTARVTHSAAAKGRRLVVVELSGGNDGLSMLVPYGIGAYHDLRQRTAVDDGDVLHLNAKVGLHKNLAQLKDRGVAVVQGVGSPVPDGSHFAMLARWWAGDVRGTGTLEGGFFGRLADIIGDPAAAAVAVSIGSGSHPALAARKVSTLALPDLDSARVLVGAKKDDDPARYAFQQAFAAMGATAATGDPSGPMLGVGKAAVSEALSFASSLGGLGDDDGDGGYPGSNLGSGLRTAARILAADDAVRIAYVPMGEDFDTHDNHRDRHAQLMADLDGALDAFHKDLRKRGLHEHVLVMTVSEFGRKARDNGSNGLDHGNGSVALLTGPVKEGLYGELPSLTKIDDDGNLIATVGLDRYYATIAEQWFGVPASEVLPGSPKPLDGLL